MPLKAAAIVSSTTAEKPQKRYPGEAKGFVEEMRFVAMKLHTREQAKEGEKEVEKPEERAVPKWEPSVEGYLRFLVDSKLVYDTLESIVDKAAYPFFFGCVNDFLDDLFGHILLDDLSWYGFMIVVGLPDGLCYYGFCFGIVSSSLWGFNLDVGNELLFCL
ncbi:hypothetical protein GH714_042428 [Hevea brasiliensis]|uniref:heme oxygenase (biliverdin-producing) n=1 Tax=Hevea brasiliensis TaxID=3981 RepID=A0A6A6ML78_HEVBR|nr:hypothetical protein GH714_042428 [Hevea brasiliensis]